jgi:hypothetical protein
MHIPNTTNIVDPAELIPSAAAAALLHIEPATLVMWRHRKKGPAFVKIGRGAFYTRQALREYISKRIVPEGR